MGFSQSKVHPIPSKSPDVLLDEIKNKHKILLVMLDGSSLKVCCFSYHVMKERQDDVKLLSYRFGDTASKFREVYDWNDAMVNIAKCGSYIISAPSQKSPALNFYDDLVRILHRTKVKCLYVEHLCCPQETLRTADIIHACGTYYDDFEVLIWVPWMTKSDSELNTYKNKIREAEDCRDDGYLVNVLGGDILSFHEQSLRGWIQREMSCTRKAMDSENKRNIDFLRFVYTLFIESTMKRHHSADSDSILIEKRQVKICDMTYALWNCLKDMRGVKYPENHILVQESAKLSIAPFTVPSDRKVVAQLEGCVAVLEVTCTVGSGSPRGSSSWEHMLLRMFTYLGSLAFEKGVLFEDWPGYDFDQATTRRLIDYFVTIVQSFVYFSEEQFIELDKLLRAGCFTAYLPEDCSALLDSKSFPSEEYCYIYVSASRCVLMFARPDVEHRVKSPWGNKYPVIDEALIQMGNIQPLLTAIESSSNGCCVGGTFIGSVVAA